MESRFGRRAAIAGMAGLATLLGVPPVSADGDKPASSTFLPAKGDTFVFFGDSITHKGAYTDPTELLATALHPELGLTFVNQGENGDTILDLQRRLDWDVLRLKPQWVSIMVGTDDVNISLANDLLHNPAPWSPVPDFIRSYTDLVIRIHATGARAICITPPMEAAIYGQRCNGELDVYAAWTRNVAQQTGALLCDAREATLEATADLGAALNDYGLTEDGIHPTPQGGAVIALALLRTLGCVIS